MSISRSKRPKRRSAASMELGRLVAAMTITCARLFRPSIRVSSCDTMRRSTCARNDVQAKVRRMDKVQAVAANQFP
eukprot:1159232-Pelagomonas_calceolata.AAC.10